MKNRKKCSFWKRNACILVCAILLSSLEAAASQTSGSLKETGEKIDELEQKKEEAQERAEALKEQESSLKGELAGLNSQLSDVSAQINDLEGQISKKQEEIEKAGQELAQSETAKEKQYESMKLRIQFMYENGGIDFAAALLSSKSIAEFLNKAEYIEAVNRYDREMLGRYEETCRQVAQKEEDLKAEQDSLLAMQESMAEKKEQVNGLIAQTEQSIQAKRGEISDAQNDVDEYEAQIAKMKAYEEELERQKAAEAKKRAEEAKKREQEARKKAEGQKKQEEGSSGGGSVTANASDLAMLAALVECEAGGESYEGQWAVASVVVNRVRSGSYPNTVSGVIYQGGQFAPVASGRFAIVLARGAASSCQKAANAALSGSTNVGFLSFCRASLGVEGTVIGNHVFF